MKQLSIFETSKSLESKAWKLYIDGAARNNPGPAGAGIYILCNDKPNKEISVYLNTKTNNQAEYLALLIGLLYIKTKAQPNDVIYIKSDSELLVKQINGIYSVKNPDLKKYFNFVHSILANLNYNISHVYREDNKIADRLANKAIDEKIPLPAELLPLWQVYDI